ncbi:NAD(P)/FAD-dependent oxidoreductase [Carnobacterium gallinarum]|uniref:NAD(P)/FAD-dependent oxidoreductase n=1 Tax=Carnobacterium gallinarum TaxID=2749 RepID=UPI0005538233|nr:FAD-dependent oxidoreductase [Carnobacterium gallinarum]
MKNQEIAVIGAGIVGATAAFYLSKAGYSVTVYDEGTGQATSAAAGIICPWLSQRRNQEWYRLASNGAAFYPTLMTDLAEDIHHSAIYQQVGALVFKKNPATLLKLEKLALKRRETAPEIGDLQILSAEEITKKIPLLVTKDSALFASGGARIDGQLLTKKLIQEAIALGATVHSTKVSIESTPERNYLIKTDTIEKEVQQVILAVGAWLPNLLVPLGYQVDIRPQKGQLAHVHLSNMKDSENWPVVIPHGEKDIIPFADGHILVGATHENDQGYDLTPSQVQIQAMIQEASDIAPALNTATLVETKVGTRAYTSDFAPFFGEVPNNPGLYAASGLGSSGLTSGPLLGKMLVQLVMGQATDLPVTDYPIEKYIVKKHDN